MKKSLVLSLALATSVAAMSTAFAAANPFADVPSKHWAYDAVSQLAKDGVVDGYSDKTFQGDKTMTRYEMAQVVGKAVARADKASAADKKLIDKLSTEFAGELNNLGVRVAALEKNQPNFKINGAIDVRYTDQDNQAYLNNTKSATAKGQYRVRLNGSAAVDENTTFGIRIATQPQKVGKTFKYNGSSFTDFGAVQSYGDNNANSIAIDQAFIATKLGAVKTTIGEQPLKIGANNFAVDSTSYSYDGVKFEGKTGAINLAAQWGRFQSIIDIASLEANSKAGNLAYGLGYYSLKDNKASDAFFGQLAKYWDFNGSYTFSKNFSLGGEYLLNKATDAGDKDGKAGLVYALFGAQSLAKKGDQNIKFSFDQTNDSSLTRYTSFDYTNGSKGLTDNRDGIMDSRAFKEFMATYSYAFSKNLNGQLIYAKVTDDQKTTGDDRGYKYYRAVLTAKF